MKYLLIIAHGSRRATSNDEVRALAARIKDSPECPYDDVRCAFLELSEPLIPAGLEQCIDNGATQITVLPYFLAAGRHVVTDIPAEINPVSEKHPDIKIELAPHLGASDNMAAFMLQHTEYCSL
jgi:sirohydrochlorin ferrochelatase